eukprot:bmy_20761T0
MDGVGLAGKILHTGLTLMLGASASGVSLGISELNVKILKGLEAIMEDEVTQRFSSEELVSWNFLTRTNDDCLYLFMPEAESTVPFLAFVVVTASAS